MAHVNSIEELKLWQTNRDASIMEGVVAATIASHSDSHHDASDLSPRAMKLIGPGHVGVCTDCDEPTFNIRDQKSGRTAPVCRGCINTVRRQSLGHGQYTAEICMSCEIITDSLGLISGVIHRTKPYEDETQPDGAIRPGIGPLIRAQRIDVTDDILSVLP